VQIHSLNARRSTIDFERLIDGKILVANLARGVIGALNARLPGMILSARLLNAAMKRASVRPENRKPFFYYVDEFQNFTTESVEDMATEGRKFGIVLHVANQSLAQIPDRMRDSILGNVSTLLIYRLGPYDACFVEPYLVPYFNFLDVMELPNHHAIARIPAHGGVSLRLNSRMQSQISRDLILTISAHLSRAFSLQAREQRLFAYHSAKRELF